MKVKDLIKQLQQLDPEDVVFVTDVNGNNIAVHDTVIPVGIDPKPLVELDKAQKKLVEEFERVVSKMINNNICLVWQHDLWQMGYFSNVYVEKSGSIQEFQDANEQKNVVNITDYIQPFKMPVEAQYFDDDFGVIFK